MFIHASPPVPPRPIVPLNTMIIAPPRVARLGQTGIGLAKDRAQDPVRIEIRLGDGPRGGAVPRVVPPQGFHRRDDVLTGAEGEQPFPTRQRFAEARVLDDGWLTGGEVSGRAVAEPAAATLHLQVHR